MQLNRNVVVGFAVAVLAFAALGAMDDAAANLLVNPGFETGDLTGWQVFGQSANSDVTAQSGDNGPSVPGTYNAFMDNQAEALGLTLKQTTVPGSATAGEVFYSYDLKLDQADVGGVLFVQVFAEETGVGIIGGSGLIGPLWPWGSWTAYSGSFIAPAGTDFLTIQFMANTGAATGSNCRAHVDNVDLNQGASPVESTSWSSVKAMFR
ncbi:MAG: hypothetical protein JXB46_02630 [Candidatus Eisenbacteria bacterium]|nr:hypothetical protein [Candidatus Eisenbacteria bacterium]